MIDCSKCPDKKCMPTGRPCAEVEKILRDGGIYGRNWIRPKMPSNERKDGLSRWRERPFSSLGLDKDGELDITP